MKDEYEVAVRWSDEDEAFVAEVSELPGCAAHGSSLEEALHEIREAVALWLDIAGEFGERIPPPATTAKGGGEVRED